MLRFLALLMLAGGGWLLYSRAAVAAAANSTEVAMVPTSDGGAIAAPVSGPGAYLAMVKQINAEEFGNWFDPALVMGLMQAESSFDPSAYRFEAALNDASYGLMQVLYSTARDRGYSGAPEGLYDPMTNIRIGMRQLKWSWDYLSTRMRGLSELQWISSYNAGVGYVAKGGSRALYYSRVAGYRDAWKGRV